MIRQILAKLPNPLQGISVRFDKTPIASVEKLTDFVQTRSSYIAQTALFGYLKTRMGTRFRVLFEDDVFSKAIREAAVKIFLSCLSDLTIFAVANLIRQGNLAPDQAAALARRVYHTAAQRGLTEVDSTMVPTDAFQRFDERLETVHWANAAEGERAFSGSGEDLIRHAPVVDEFKELDEEIVKNSIRFRWRDVREQFRNRIDAEAVCADWLDAVDASA